MLSKLLIDKTKPQTKSVRLSDGRGMYLEISPTGGKWWRFKYRLDGKEKRISLGVYPDVGLADARDKREEARRLVAAGIDPTEHRKVGALLRAIDSYEGAWITRCASRLAPLVFVRPGELRQAQWAEFDFEKSEWRIPATRMKMREIGRAHV